MTSAQLKMAASDRIKKLANRTIPGKILTPAEMQEIEAGRQAVLRKHASDNRWGTQPQTFPEVK